MSQQPFSYHDIRLAYCLAQIFYHEDGDPQSFIGHDTSQSLVGFPNPMHDEPQPLIRLDASSCLGHDIHCHDPHTRSKNPPDILDPFCESWHSFVPLSFYLKLFSVSRFPSGVLLSFSTHRVVSFSRWLFSVQLFKPSISWPPRSFYVSRGREEISSSSCLFSFTRFFCWRDRQLFSSIALPFSVFHRLLFSWLRLPWPLRLPSFSQLLQLSWTRRRSQQQPHPPSSWQEPWPSLPCLRLLFRGHPPFSWPLRLSFSSRWLSMRPGAGCERARP